MARGDDRKFICYLNEDECKEADELKDFLFNKRILPPGKNNSRYALAKFGIRFLMSNKGIFDNYDLFEDITKVLLKNGSINNATDTLTYLVKWAYYILSDMDALEEKAEQSVAEETAS